MALRLAVVFPGQGTASGEVSSELWGLVGRVVGDGKVPYQLSVFASSVATFHEMRGRGVEPAVVAGHSLGEYAAAYASGSLGLADGARLVAERDRLMTEASRETPGGMTVIMGPGPREVLEAGEEGALADVAERVRGKKYKLDVAGAFHSPFMQGAAVGMDRLLAEVSLEDPKVPIVSGMDGAILTKADDVRLALRDQMLSPVQWVAVVERFAALGVEEVVEAGGGTLVRMLRDFEDVEMRGRAAREVLA